MNKQGISKQELIEKLKARLIDTSEQNTKEFTFSDCANSELKYAIYLAAQLSEPSEVGCEVVNPNSDGDIDNCAFLECLNCDTRFSNTAWRCDTECYTSFCPNCGLRINRTDNGGK